MSIHKKTTRETGKPNKCSTNTTSIPNSNSGDKTIIIEDINSKINYFIQVPNKKLIKGQVQESHNNNIESSNMYSLGLHALMAHSHYR